MRKGFIFIGLYGYLRRSLTDFVLLGNRENRQIARPWKSIAGTVASAHIIGLSCSTLSGIFPPEDIPHLGLRARRSARTSFARSIRTFRSLTSISATRATSSPPAPTVAPTLPAWSHRPPAR